MPRVRRRDNKEKNKEIQEKIVQYLREGMSREGAANKAGISKVTFYKLLERAKYSNKGTEAREFYEAVIRAEAEVEAEMVERWKAKTDQDWKAAMHYLARRFPDRWSASRKEEAPKEKAGIKRIIFGKGQEE